MPDSYSKSRKEDTDQHIDDCDVCGDGEGVCLTGYLLATLEGENAA